MLLTQKMTCVATPGKTNKQTIKTPKQNSHSLEQKYREGDNRFIFNEAAAAVMDRTIILRSKFHHYKSLV